MKRFIPLKRTALDGIVWWCVFDRKNGRHSTLTCHGRYKTKKDCLWKIDWYERESWYVNSL